MNFHLYCEIVMNCCVCESCHYWLLRLWRFALKMLSIYVMLIKWHCSKVTVAGELTYSSFKHYNHMLILMILFLFYIPHLTNLSVLNMEPNKKISDSIIFTRSILRATKEMKIQVLQLDRSLDQWYHKRNIYHLRKIQHIAIWHSVGAIWYRAIQETSFVNSTITEKV